MVFVFAKDLGSQLYKIKFFEFFFFAIHSTESVFKNPLPTVVSFFYGIRSQSGKHHKGVQ